MTRRQLVLIAALTLCLAAWSARAGDDEFAPGSVPDLGADEGYVMLLSDSAVALDDIKLSKEKGIAFAHVFKRIESGRSLRLIKLPAGNYHWAKLESANRYWDLSDDADLGFKVERGVINYPGTLVITHTSGLWLGAHRRDEATVAIQAMERNFPAQMGRYPLVYQGQAPDPYPDFYHRMKEKYAGAATAAMAPDSTSQRFTMDVGLPAERLFGGSEISMIRLSPDGGLIAETVTERGKKAVYLFDVASADFVKLKGSEDVSDITWVGKRILALDTNDGFVLIYRLPASTAAAASTASESLPGDGYVMTALPGRDGRFLYASFGTSGLTIHEVDGNVSGLDWPKIRSTRNLAPSVDGDYLWLADRKGDVRLGLVKVDKQAALYFRGKDEAKPHEVMRMDGDDDFTPVGLADDGTHFYALTNRSRAQRDLVLVDGADGRIGATVFSRPGTDISGAVLGNASMEPIGVRYAEDGQIRTVYFAGSNVQLQKKLDASFPDRTAFILEVSDDGKLAVIRTEGPANPAEYFLFHVDENRAESLSINSADAKLIYAHSTVIRSKSRDGLEVESYLTMPPRAAASSPLLVLPHGGPIGVRDYNLFDAEAQFFASRGFAVLKVNYRGSDGFGKSFESAGEGAWGMAIEDDIQSAVEAALLKPGLDRKRIAILGTSYGGYSALMSMIRFPQQYRCAVAIAAPSDLPLMFNSSDWSYSDKLRERMKKIVGDPASELEKLERVSPVYQFERIQHPVMLVHGDQDRRAAMEHSLRMLQVLRLKGIDAESIRLEGGGHGISRPEDAAFAYGQIADFLARNLN